MYGNAILCITWQKCYKENQHGHLSAVWVRMHVCVGGCVHQYSVFHSSTLISTPADSSQSGSVTSSSTSQMGHQRQKVQAQQYPASSSERSAVPLGMTGTLLLSQCL